MVKLFSQSHTYLHPWNNVTSAFWRKYPNPLAPQVIEVDCYDRSLDVKSGDLTTRRIVTCEIGGLPDWMSQIGVSNRIFCYETTVVNAERQEMVVKSRNLTMSSVMLIEETCAYKSHPSNANWTQYSQEARISAFFPLLSSRLESFTHTCLSSKAIKGLEAIEFLCQRIHKEGIESLTHLSGVYDAFVKNFFSSSSVEQNKSQSPSSSN